MRRFFNWQIILALILISASIIFYFIHFLIFHDLHHIFLYLIGDVAFLFIDVLIVTLVLNRLLEHTGKQAILKKLNMVIGAFFSEVGTELLKKYAKFNQDISVINSKLLIDESWLDKDFVLARKNIYKHESIIVSSKGNLIELRDFLVSKRQFLLRLLENPNLLEHQSFTNLLWAVFHLTEELAYRPDLTKIPESDSKHLSKDMLRVYEALILQWLEYMKHLKKDYPYLFSLAARVNPFNANASIEVR